jgi:uncharacterized HhH-GPD family protein
VATATPSRLYFTPDDEANELLAREPLALLIGFCLDQQVTVQKAFAGPRELERRLGSLDAGAIAHTDPGELERVFAQKPALHRFPGTMARRTQELCSVIDERYGGDASRIWREAKDGRDLEHRLGELPGFGDMKVRGVLAVLAKRFGLELDGLDDVVPKHPTLGDVDSAEALERYQAAKREHKAKLRASREQAS